MLYLNIVSAIIRHFLYKMKQKDIFRYVRIMFLTTQTGRAHLCKMYVVCEH